VVGWLIIFYLASQISDNWAVSYTDSYAWFQASAAKYLRSAPFWIIT